MMSTKGLGLFAGLLGIAACGASDGEGKSVGLPKGGVLIDFSPDTDGEGFCRPSRIVLADVGTTGLTAIRGDAIYTLPDGQTEIPFQSLHKYPDDQGVAKDEAVTNLNQQGPCSDLSITIEVATCEYSNNQGFKKGSCPEAMAVSGTEGFKSVELVREDR